MWVWVDRIGAEVLDVGVPVLALSGVVALTMIGTRQPARRMRLGRASLLGILALVVLIGLRVVPRYDVIAAFRDSGLVPGLGASRAEPEPVAIDLAPSHLTRVGRGLTLVYLVVLLLGLARLGLGLLGLSWLTARSVAPATETDALFRSLPLADGQRRPRLRVVGRVRRPGLVGLFRPTILVPTELEGPEARDRLRLSLLHELAHAERADPWFGLAGNLAQAFFFFLPPVRWVVAQMRLDQEFLADRRASTEFGQAGAYASSLLGFTAPRRVSGPSLGVAPDTEGQSSALFQRVLMLIRCPFQLEQTPPAWWTWGLIGLGLPLTLGTACLSVGPTTDRPAPHSPAPPPSGSFTVARLVVPPNPPGLHGRAPLFELPIRLPEEFDLTVEVWGDRDALAQTRVAGLPLKLSGDAGGPNDPASWHVVHIRRLPSGLSLRIDGLSRPGRPEETAVTAWLSVEPPPNREGRFRKLVLTWGPDA